MKNTYVYICTLLILLCQAQDSFALPYQVNNVCGSELGSINIELDAPNGPFQYIWSNGSTTSGISNIPAGIYTVTVSDAHDCTATESIEVEQTGAIINSFTTTCAPVNPDDITDAVTTAEIVLGGNIAFPINYFTNMQEVIDELGNVEGVVELETTELSIPTGYVIFNNIYNLTIVDANGCVTTATAVMDCTCDETPYYDYELDCTGDFTTVVNIYCTPHPFYWQLQYDHDDDTSTPWQIITSGTSYTNEIPIAYATTDDFDEYDARIQIFSGTDSSGDLLFTFGNFECLSPVGGLSEGDSCDNDSAPSFSEDIVTTVQACVGREVCISFYASDEDGIKDVTVNTGSTATVSETMTYGGQTYPELDYGEITAFAEGKFCWIPNEEDIGNKTVIVRAYDDIAPLYCPESALQAYTINISCCIDGVEFGTQNATVGCNGEQLAGGSVEFIPFKIAACEHEPTQFLVNSGTQTTVTDLSAGNHTFDITVDGATYQQNVVIGEQTIPANHVNVSVNKQPTTGTCFNDNCTGSITLSTSGGYGSYYYNWSDCPDFEALSTEEASLPYCDGLSSTTRNNLCAGNYRVTVTDMETGCSTTKTINILMSSGSGGGTNIDDSEPDLRLFPVVYSSNTTITYDIKEDAEVTLKVYNALGQPVTTLVNSESKAPGTYTLQHNSESLNSGIYIYHLQVCNKVKGKLGIKQD